jgi:hypothetical protein
LFFLSAERRGAEDQQRADPHPIPTRNQPRPCGPAPLDVLRQLALRTSLSGHAQHLWKRGCARSSALPHGKIVCRRPILLGHQWLSPPGRGLYTGQFAAIHAEKGAEPWFGQKIRSPRFRVPRLCFGLTCEANDESFPVSLSFWEKGAQPLLAGWVRRAVAS